MSDEKRKNARTQGRYSGGDKEFASRKDKQNSKMPSPTDKNKGEKRKAPTVGSRVQNKMNLQYEDESNYSFKEFEPVKKPQELSFTDPELVLSETENGVSRLIYVPNFMKLAEAEEYFQILHSSTVWSDKNIVIRGEEYPQPRLVAWYGPYPYTYAGATLEAKEMTSTVLEIKEKVEASLSKHGVDVVLNSVLLNLYRNEKDSVAWHSDDEFSLGVCPTIASVSLGTSRKFEMRPKEHVKDLDPNNISYVNLTNGSLIVMDGCMQKDWLHRVPKEYHDRGPRINLTFRTIYPADQLPPEMPRVPNLKSVRSPDTKEVHQQNHKFNVENFPPLGMEASVKKSKSLSKDKNGKNGQQRKSQKEENCHVEMSQPIEDPEESPDVLNNLSKNSNSDPGVNSPELQSSQVDFNSNIKESAKSGHSKSFSNECIKRDYHSDSSETNQSNEVSELESEDPSPSECKPVNMKSESAEVNARTANSGKKYTLNANAPEYVPQNKFEKYSLSELANHCKFSDNVRNEDLQSFTEVLFKCVDANKSLFINRDLYELEVYDKLNDGSLSDKHLKIILERISSMILNAFYKKNEPRYSRYSNDNYRKPKQSYTRSHKY